MGEPIDLSWKGAPKKASYKVAVTQVDQPPIAKNVQLFLHTCGGKKCKDGDTPKKKGIVTMDEGKPKEGGKGSFPLPPGAYDAHLANKGKSKTGAASFIVTE